MQAYIRALSVYVLASLFCLGIWYYSPIEIPKVQVQPYTESYLNDQFRAEQKQKEINRAIEVSAHMYHNHNCSSFLAGPTVKYASLHNLPVRLVTAVIIVESSCHDDITNRKSGATGLMQIMPGLHGASRRALLDRETNIAVGTRLLGTLIHTHGMEEGVASYFGITPGSDAGWDYAYHVFQVAGYRR